MTHDAVCREGLMTSDPPQRLPPEWRAGSLAAVAEARPTMNAILGRFLGASLFQRETGTVDAWRIIGWWEVRRVAFNLIIGIAGIVTITTGVLAMSIANAFLETPIQRPDPPLFFFAFLYAVVVNVFYTGGWVAELCWRRCWRTDPSGLAMLSFRLGLVLSILVTLFPAVIAVAFAVHAIFARKPLISP